MTAYAVQKNQSPWWLTLIGGVAAIIVGILLWSNPLRVSNVLVWTIGLYWLVTGVFYLVSLIWDRSQMIWKIIGGVIGIIAGWWLINAGPVERVAVMGLSIGLVLGIQGILTGVMGLIAAFQGGGWGVGIMGVISIVIGILILGNLFLTALVTPMVIAIFLIVGGIFAIIGAFTMR